MAFSLITSWQISGRNLKTVTDSIFLCSNITGNSDCSNEIKKKKSQTNKKKHTCSLVEKPRQQIKKKRHSLLTKSR